MSSFWNIWVWVLTLGTLVGCFILLRWCLKNFAGVEEGESMGHTFDGIEELNNPLPHWMKNTVLFSPPMQRELLKIYQRIVKR